MPDVRSLITFGRHDLLRDPAHDLRGTRHDHGVVEHEDLRVEQRRQFGTAAPGHARPDFVELLPGEGAAATALLATAKRNGKFMGVCSGIADYTGLDVTLVRIMFVTTVVP